MSTDDPDALPSAAGKRIVAPDGSGIVPTSKPRPDGTLVKALARAWRWQRMLDEGVHTSVSEIGDDENMLAATQNQIEADLPGAVLGLERVIQTERRGLARAKGTGCATLKFCYSWRIVNEWLMKLDR